MMKRSNQCRPIERVAHRLKGDLGAELTKVASEQVVNKASWPGQLDEKANPIRSRKE